MKKYFLALVICWLLPSLSIAETVILKSGKVLEGRIKEKTDKQILLNYHDQDLYYELKSIETIDGKRPQDFSLAAMKIDASEISGPFENGLWLASTRKFAEAFDSFKKSLNENPMDTNALEAIHILEDLRAGKITDDFAQALFEGTLLFLKQRFDAASVSFQRALELKPDAVELYYNLGNLYNAMGQYRSAILYFEKILKQNPLDAEVLFSLGFSHFSLNEYLKASGYFERYIALVPQDPQAHGFLGSCYYALGRENQAMEEFQTAQNLSSDEDIAESAVPEPGSLREEGIRQIINNF